MGNSKNALSLLTVIVMAYITDLFAELKSVSGPSLAEETINAMFNDTLALTVGGSTPVDALATDIKTAGTAVVVDDEYQALKFARYLTKNASLADIETYVFGGGLLTVASLAPKIVDGVEEDLSSVTIAEKIIRCIENKYTDLDRPSVTYRTVIANLRAELAA